MNITDELRKYAELDCTRCGGQKDLLDIADRIDAVHKRAIGYIDDRDPETMAEHGWIRLQKDGNGEYVHVGDVMENGMARGRVIALMLSEYPKKWGGGLHWSIQLEGEHAPTALDLTFRHYHAPTVEDVLFEMYNRLDEPSGNDSNKTLEEIITEYAAKLQLKED